MLAIAVLGVSATSAQAITVGDFVLLTTYMLQIVQPLELAGFAMRDLAQGANYLDKWAEVERLPEEPGLGDKEPQVLLGHPPTIAFENVSFAYSPDRPALTDIDFTLPAGSLVAIVGPSGAGKSSLVRLILGHYRPASGRVLVDGVPVSDLDVHELRRRAAVVAQDAPLFNDSLKNNLLFARPDASDEAIQHALTVARLDQLVARLPDGLATQVGERGLSLSGGERQRVAIARAVLRNSQLLLLDEATSALDAETERGLCADLEQFAHGRTTLIVTHRLALASRARTIFVLDKGQIVERGTHSSLIAGRGLYFRLWQSQSRLGEERPACS
jgi:ATP-binding cassette subfamily B protein